MSKRDLIIVIVLAALTAILATVSFIVLPAQVAAQVSCDGQASNILPKWASVGISTLLSVCGIVGICCSKNNAKLFRNSCIVAGVGVFSFVATLLINFLL